MCPPRTTVHHHITSQKTAEVAGLRWCMILRKRRCITASLHHRAAPQVMRMMGDANAYAKPHASPQTRRNPPFFHPSPLDGQGIPGGGGMQESIGFPRFARVVPTFRPILGKQ
jgi:hypothetical protein